MLGLNAMRPNRRGARFGFPAAHFSRHLAKLLHHGVPVLVVREQDRQWTRIRERLPVYRCEPA